MVSSFLFYTGGIGVVCGVAARSLFSFGLPEICWVGVVGVVLVILWSKKSSAFFAPQLLLCSVFLLLFALGALRMEIATWYESS